MKCYMKCAKCKRVIPSLPCPFCGSNTETLQEFAKEGGTGQRKAR
jgi:RNA polymerase subunit RPABC4/transcription elongation factor Spt4